VIAIRTSGSAAVRDTPMRRLGPGGRLDAPAILAVIPLQLLAYSIARRRDLTWISRATWPRR